jgi:HK97 family phage major capsid protein
MLKAKADGASVSDLQAKMEKINADFVEQRKAMDDIQKKANRPDLAAEMEGKKGWEELNVALKTFGNTGDNSKLAELHRKAMNSTSDPDGGFFVLPELDTSIDRIAQTMGALGRLASTTQIGSQQWKKMVKTAGMSMRRVGNGATGGETTEPTFAELTIEAFVAEVEPWIHNETLEDARIDMAADLIDEAAIAFSEGANAEYITGNGVGQARGILGYTNVHNSSYAWGSVGYIRSGKSGAFMSVAPADRVVSLQHALKPQYRPGAAWLTNDATLGMMRQIKDGSGSYYLWTPATESFGGKFLGSPVEVDDNMPDLGAGSYSLAFGNWARAYQIVNRAGTSLIRDNITSKGVTKFNLRKRFGAGVKNFEAFKVMAFVTGTA